MKAILLAAGIGSRIAQHISQEHKCLLPIHTSERNAIPLIAYTVDSLLQQGISHITVVTGYKHKKVEDSLSQYTTVQCVHNPFYYIVNSIGSLWFAKNTLLQETEATMIMNADTFLDTSIFHMAFDAIQKTETPILLVDSSRKNVADVKVTYNQENVLEAYGKDIPHVSMAESVDVALIPKSFVHTLYAQLTAMLEQRQHATWWESALVEYKDRPISVIDIAGTFWSEIDFIEDYQRICDYVKTNSI